MKFYNNILVLVILGSFAACSTTDDEPENNNPVAVNTPPPYGGTIFIENEIVTSDDSSSFTSLEDKGTGDRTVFDRRINDWTTINAFLFKAEYADGDAIEIQVNPEFNTVALARAEAEKYAKEVGRLPVVLRSDVEYVWVHKGTELYGGGNRSILIHTGQTAIYENDGILEETLIHEAAHTSLDADHATAAAWRAAQTADATFISDYAKEYPEREDIAESYLMYLAVTFRADRISEENKRKIETAIPNRIAYFNSLNLNNSPIN